MTDVKALIILYQIEVVLNYCQDEIKETVSNEKKGRKFVKSTKSVFPLPYYSGMYLYFPNLFGQIQFHAFGVHTP